MTILKPNNDIKYSSRLWITPGMKKFNQLLINNNIDVICTISLLPEKWYNNKHIYLKNNKKFITNFATKFEIFNINLSLNGSKNKKEIENIQNKYNFSFTKNDKNKTIRLLNIKNIYNYKKIRYGYYKCPKFDIAFNLMKELLPDLTIQDFLKIGIESNKKEDIGKSKFLIKKEYDGDENLYEDLYIEKMQDISHTLITIRLIATDIDGNKSNLLNIINDLVKL